MASSFQYCNRSVPECKPQLDFQLAGKLNYSKLSPRKPRKLFNLSTFPVETRGYSAAVPKNNGVTANGPVMAKNRGCPGNLTCLIPTERL